MKRNIGKERAAALDRLPTRLLFLLPIKSCVVKAFVLKKEDVEKFIIEALASEPKAMIELLIDKIILYEDRIEIFYIYGNNTDPDEPNLEVHRDFFLSSQKIKITQRGFEATFELEL